MAPAWLGDASLILLSLLVQGIPFLLLGAALGAVASAWRTPWPQARGWPRNAALSALSGACGALLVPACDCAVVPIARRLIRKGAPVSACVAYLIAAPSLNPICLVSTWLAFRIGSPWHFVALRAGGTLVLAVLTGLIAGRLAPRLLLRPEILFRGGSENEPAPWMELRPNLSPRAAKIGAVIAATLTDFLNVSALYVAGAACSALLQTFLPLGSITAPRGPLSLATPMLLAFLLSLCSSADAFVVNALGHLGAAGQMAFLWFGPVYNLRVLFLYRGIFTTRAILLLGAALFVEVLILAATLGRYA